VLIDERGAFAVMPNPGMGWAHDLVADPGSMRDLGGQMMTQSGGSYSQAPKPGHPAVMVVGRVAPAVRQPRCRAGIHLRAATSSVARMIAADRSAERVRRVRDPGQAGPLVIRGQRRSTTRALPHAAETAQPVDGD
jgi:hypothetical protein